MTQMELELYERLVKLLGKEGALRAMIMRGYFENMTLSEARKELKNETQRTQ